MESMRMLPVVAFARLRLLDKESIMIILNYHYHSTKIQTVWLLGPDLVSVGLWVLRPFLG